jgi:CBS domain-containing protein
MNKLAEKLASLDIKIHKVKDPADPRQEALEFVWSEDETDEGEERFEVPEEEEAEEEAILPRTGAGRGGRGTAPTGRGGRRATNNRGRPRPRPEPVRSLDLSQIHSFSDVLKNISVQRIVYENWTRKKLVLVGANQPVERALSRINTHNILSLPVVDVNNPNGAVIGLLDVLDIISALSETLESGTARPQRRDMLFTPISDIMSKKSHPPTYIISISTSLHDAVKQFAQNKFSRIMIVDRPLEQTIMQQEKPEELVVGLLTQSDLIRFVAENLMWIKKEKIFQQTLRELGLGQRKPIIVDQTIQAYQAFLEIHRNGREGVALVDATGKLIANVSASNIKGMTRRNFQLLFRPLTHFLSRDRKRGWWQLPVCTTLDTTLENSVLQFVAAKVHRMYIVDNDGKPIGEISLSDVVQQLGNL